MPWIFTSRSTSCDASLTFSGACLLFPARHLAAAVAAVATLMNTQNKPTFDRTLCLYYYPRPITATIRRELNANRYPHILCPRIFCPAENVCAGAGSGERCRQVGDYDNFTEERDRLFMWCRRRLTCTVDDAWGSSRHGYRQGTVTGRFPNSSSRGAVCGGRVE
ncbi:hypothetical protein EVAR_55035_1 [Eumeta japonica]|uniref:Uncharacterized protein n=1 Tax=Eumeta variegata TaxID=151549 RepID=A0A4C1ZN92_EUMVA|nr:hypothetical protein EVAR_55035_1 [Eumeta japonica]